MKPFPALFLGCILFSLWACGEEDYAPKKYMGLKGKVTSIRDTVYDCTLQGFYPGSGELVAVQTVDFDTEGRVIKTTDCNADSSMVVTTESVYKDDALFSTRVRRCIGEDIFTYTSERISMENGILRYKEDNGTQQWINEVKTTGKYLLEYSEGEYGYTKEESWADNDNNIIKTKYLLVSNEERFADGTDTLETVKKMKYDKEGNVTESVDTGKDKTAVTVYTYHRYDKQGNWTEQRAETDGYFKRQVKRTITYAEDSPGL